MICVLKGAMFMTQLAKRHYPSSDHGFHGSLRAMAMS